ncbi:MAG: hypothetical protein GY793_09530 [Proteobacteria bacterium]|nr:hypothetical protein [Pseudomonadota bacterium]
MTFLTKKAAMFGLDARIALAIFAALSLITGATLYKTIQHVKVISFINEFNEIGKAHDAYMLDTGQTLPKSVTLTNYGETLNLIENDAGVTGWKGPYLSSEYKDGTNANGKWLKKYAAGDVFPIWFQYLNHNRLACTDSDCQIWAHIEFPKTEGYLTTIQQIDIKIDGIENATEGSLRYSEGSSTYGVNYRYSAISKKLVLP